MQKESKEVQKESKEVQKNIFDFFALISYNVFILSLEVKK